MSTYSLVDLSHDTDGLVEGDNDFLVVGEVVISESATLTVLEPLM